MDYFNFNGFILIFSLMNYFILFNVISMFMDYFMPKLSLEKDSNSTI